jgi:nucleoid-associated protein YgaU
LRLKQRAADNALAQAKERLDWAGSVGAETRYADQYAGAKADYAAAVAARKAEDLDGAIALARKVMSQLASVREAPPVVEVPVVEVPVVVVPVVVPVVETPKPITYPASYKVRPWAETKDCFWNIAGYPWVYNDPTKWPVLYEANKTKLKRPNDPNLLNVGIVLTIPSIQGEIREGIWEKGRSYSPLAKLPSAKRK